MELAKFLSQVKTKKTDYAVTADPSLTPSDIASGKGLGFLPAAVDGASCHSRKLLSKKLRREKD